MEWEFTPEQVVKGEGGYGLEDFRRDLAVEARMNMGNMEEADFQSAYQLVYDLCYWLATGKTFEDFVEAFLHDPPTYRFVSCLRDSMQGNVGMLGAILQRLIMDRVEAGQPVEAAVESVAAFHRQCVEKNPAVPGLCS